MRRPLARPSPVRHLRVRVPADLVGRFGRREIKCSTGTDDPALSRIRHARMLAALLELFQTVRADPMLTPAVINATARALLLAVRADDREARVRRRPSRLRTASSWAEQRRRWSEALVEGDAAPVRAALALVPDAPATDEDDPLYPSLVEAGLRALHEGARQCARRDAGEFQLDGGGDPLVAITEEEALLPPGWTAGGAAAARPSPPREAEEPPSSGSAPPSAPDREPDADRMVPEETVPVLGPATLARLGRGIAPRDRRRSATLQGPQDMTPGALAERMIDRNGVSEGTAHKVRQAVRAFEELVGRRPLYRYVTSDALLFRDMLRLMPSQPGGHRPEEERLPLADQIERNLAADPDRRRPVVSLSTQKNGYFTFVKSVFRFAVEQHAVETAIFDGVRLAAAKGETRRRKAARRPFKPAELAAILDGLADEMETAAPRSQRVGTTWSWLVLLMAFGGLRPHEAGQLVHEDLRYTAYGYPCIHISGTASASEGCDDEFGGGRRGVKSAAAERVIPVHPVLVRAGLLALFRRARRNPGRRVFPEWRAESKTGRYSVAANKFFNRDEHDNKGFFVRHHVKAEKTALYSLRHNYKDLLRSHGFGETEQNYLMGHADTTVSALYGEEGLSRPLVERIMRSTHDVDPRRIIAAMDAAGYGGADDYRRFVAEFAKGDPLPWERRRVSGADGGDLPGAVLAPFHAVRSPPGAAAADSGSAAAGR